MWTWTTLAISAALLWAGLRIGWTTQRGVVTRDQVLGLSVRRYRRVRLAGVFFRIRSLTEDEKSIFESSILAGNDLDTDALLTARRRLVAMCLVDDVGDSLFGMDDEAKLGGMDGRVMSDLYDAIREHCGFEEYDVRELADVAGLLRDMGELPTATAARTKTRNGRERDAMKQMFSGRN